MRATDVTQDLVLKALSFAAREHQGQLRKDDMTPYMAHPMRVTMIMATVFRVTDPELLAVAALHDTIEDTTADRDDLIEQFGEKVAQYVALLSKDKRLPEEQREEEYKQQLAAAPLDVQIAKLADVYDNLIDASGHGAEFHQKFIRKAVEWVDLFAPNIPDQWQHVVDILRERIEAARSDQQ